MGKNGKTPCFTMSNSFINFMWDICIGVINSEEIANSGCYDNALKKHDKSMITKNKL